MRTIAGKVRDMNEGRATEDRGDVESGETGLFFEFTQAALECGLMRFDVTPGSTPVEQAMANEQDEATRGIENPSRRAHMTGNESQLVIRSGIETLDKFQ